jgi:hypothetical protein
MFSTLRTRFGIPGVISVIALVFAMFGGAYAASNSSGGGKATASAKAKKGPRGPKGATGPAGPAGPVGPTGAKGDAGANGSNGSNGAAGAAGAAGQSVTAEEFTGSKEGHCTNGGSKFTVGATKTFACSGEEGLQGNAGSPWPAGGKLPAGSTETGVWSAIGTPATAPHGINVPFSFSIPLENSLDGSHVHFFQEENFATTCTGSAANPTAPSGNLCVYGSIIQASAEISSPVTGEPGAAVAGTTLHFQPAGEFAAAGGTWAVTG